MTVTIDPNRTVWRHIWDAIRPHVDTDEEADRLTRAIHPNAVALRRYQNEGHSNDRTV